MSCIKVHIAHLRRRTLVLRIDENGNSMPDLALLSQTVECQSDIRIRIVPGSAFWCSISNTSMPEMNRSYAKQISDSPLASTRFLEVGMEPAPNGCNRHSSCCALPIRSSEALCKGWPKPESGKGHIPDIVFSSACSLGVTFGAKSTIVEMK